MYFFKDTSPLFGKKAFQYFEKLELIGLSRNALNIKPYFVLEQ